MDRVSEFSVLTERPVDRQPEVRIVFRESEYIWLRILVNSALFTNSIPILTHYNDELTEVLGVEEEWEVTQEVEPWKPDRG